jgi:hypothetical protein
MKLQGKELGVDYKRKFSSYVANEDLSQGISGGGQKLCSAEYIFRATLLPRLPISSGGTKLTCHSNLDKKTHPACVKARLNFRVYVTKC